MANSLERRQRAAHGAEVAVSDEVLDEVDQAQRRSEEHFTALLDSAMTEAWIQVRRALLAVDEGRYGYCERCGRGIAAARLAFRPESTTCLDCQTAQERGAQKGLRLIRSA